MSKKDTVRLSVEFPLEEHAYLKMLCAKMHVSMKEFVTESIIKAVEDYEDKLDKKAIEQARQDVKEHGTVGWSEKEKELGWDRV